MESNVATAEKPPITDPQVEEAEAKTGSLPEEEPSKTVKTDPAPDAGNDIDAFIQRMSAPRKENKRAFAMAEAEDPEDDGEPITDDDEANLEHLNYSPDHRNTALFFIGLLDSAMGWLGMYATGQEPERYQKFANSNPPDFYVDSAAAMVKKYHARMSLEMMFLTALGMVYGPTVATIQQDRKILKEKEMEEKIRNRERSARIV
ncbi:hypothetical protein [Flavilitoribacter nigricans]|uniref:Uncharacterized protein n=1 Tax=Flavilitoribacter nigricans (strain ATCC 23147 / DSM 23189 / NBRC 102662 / NCIMB 1420 / SS-2) TaxID=1122177 RepID=A0A2D0NCC0_FLAN2|nr:hypothetical protein [Flavilitoribacter nigricans]PHN06154.1 hypothetical protein CRP01_11255 [Flavilitoribacter nigricans DSM 23189 = NBRC 102662]